MYKSGKLLNNIVNRQLILEEENAQKGFFDDDDIGDEETETYAKSSTSIRYIR